MNRLLLIGGAALLLAACDSATAPTITQHDGPAASIKKPTIGAPKSGPVMNTMSGCNGWAHDGGDSTVANPICIAQ